MEEGTSGLDGGVRAQESAAGEFAEGEERLVAPGTIRLHTEGHVGVRDGRLEVAELDGFAVLVGLAVVAASGCVEGLFAGGRGVRGGCGVADVEVVVGARGRVVVDGKDVTGAEGLAVLASLALEGRGGAEGGFELGEEAARGGKASETFREGVVAVAGKVFALRCVETRGEIGFAALGAEGVAVEVVGGAAEAVGEDGREDSRLKDVAAAGDSVEEEAGAFL